MLWRGIDFGWAQGAYLLPFGLVIFILYMLLDRYRQKKLSNFGEVAVRKAVVLERSSVLFWTKVILLTFVWVCTVASFMQPRGNPRIPGVSQGDSIKTKVQETERRHDIVFLLDVSASMEVADNGQGDAKRLSVAKEIVDTIISNLKGENVALVAFTSQSLPIVPLTTDYLFTRLMLRGLDINEGETAGTNFLQGISGTEDDFMKTPKEVAKTLVILSDGDDTDRSTSHTKAIVDEINKLKSRDVRVMAVGVGAPEGSTVPNLKYKNESVTSAQQAHLLQSIASPKKYYDADTNSSLIIAQQIGKDISGRTLVRNFEGETISNQEILEYDHYFQYPLALALLSLALFLFIPETLHRKHSHEGVLS